MWTTAAKSPSNVIRLLRQIELFKMKDRFSEYNRERLELGFNAKFLLVLPHHSTGKLQFRKIPYASLTDFGEIPVTGRNLNIKILIILKIIYHKYLAW